MTLPREQHWYPLSYADEIMPTPRPTPDAWIVDHAGAGALCPADEGGEPQPLRDGVDVAFVRCDVFGDAELTIEADGSWRVSADMPAEADQVCALDGFQPDTVSASVAECVQALREAGHDAPDTYRLSYYSYSDAISLRFDAAGRRFVQVTLQ